MAKSEPIFTRATFQFFRDLARNNRKVWMDANRERYQEFVVKPFRRLLEEVSPAVLQLDSRFDTTGRAGANFSRINRDIRFAKDKTPYRAQMYLKFSAPFPGEGETGQLYTGISAERGNRGIPHLFWWKTQGICAQPDRGDARSGAAESGLHNKRSAWPGATKATGTASEKGEWTQQRRLADSCRTTGKNYRRGSCAVS